MTRRIPTLSRNGILGNLSELRAGMLPFFERCRSEHGPIVAFRLGWRRVILASDPTLIHEVLVTKNKSFQKHYATRLLKPVLGNGLLTSEGQAWLRQRRLIQPAFSHRFTRKFQEIVAFHTDRLAQQWRRNPQRDLYHDMTQLTVRIAAHAFLGISDTVETEKIGKCLEHIHADYEHRFQHAWNIPNWVPTPRNRRLQSAVHQLTAILDRMIHRRQHELNEQHDALSLLLRATDEQGQQMPLQLLRDEVMTLLLAGHDTTANGLTWTWFLLSQHPEVMNHLKESLRHSYAGNSKPECTSLAYKIVKESMRLFPPVYVFGREAKCDVEIDGYRIKKGESVLMSQWVIHRDEQYYPKSDLFCPERWTPEFEQQLPKYAYLPFGGGPRACIGKHLAMLEAEQIIATLANEFTVNVDFPERVEPWPTVTLRPKDAVWAVAEDASKSACSKPRRFVQSPEQS